MRTKRSCATLVLLGLFALSAVPSAAVDVSGLTFLDGSEVGASGLPDNAILIVFATWSPRCRQIAEKGDAIAKRWGAIAPVFLVDFQEDAETVERFLGSKSSKAAVLLDRRAVFSKAHSITSLPGLLAIKDGKPAFRGKLPADVDSVLRTIYE